MQTDSALSILAALGHPTRLDAFRLLVKHEPDGLSTGQLVEASGLTQSTFSTHLAVLAKAGLVISEKRGRQIIQRADIDVLPEGVKVGDRLEAQSGEHTILVEVTELDDDGATLDANHPLAGKTLVFDIEIHSIGD